MSLDACNTEKSELQRKIIERLLSRFVVLEIPGYTFEEFSQISVARLARENIRKSIARFIAESVWNELARRILGNVLKIGRVTTDIQEVLFVVSMMKRRPRNSDSCDCR